MKCPTCNGTGKERFYKDVMEAIEMEDIDGTEGVKDE